MRKRAGGGGIGRFFKGYMYRSSVIYEVVPSRTVLGGYLVLDLRLNV